MLKIKIIAVGKIKEKFLQSGIDEYLKRLQAFCKVEIINVNETKFVGIPNDEQIKKIVKSESERIYKQIKENEYVIATKIEGKEVTSVELAEKILKIEHQYSTIDFIVGGSYGLPKDFHSNFNISFGKLTYPHQLFQLIMCEQVYRTFMINNNRQYHK